MRICVFPGSFDPVTAGHLDVIARASAIFDSVFVTVMVNPGKQGALSVKDRILLLQKACRRFENVAVDQWDGLLADYMRELNARVLIRGVRTCSEFEHEYTAALINRDLNEQIETLLLPSDPGLSHVSSSMVKEIAAFGGDISAFVPKECLQDIRRALSKKD